jgi:MFS transporter, Spinster family, sphingosine-1-phosphate transporter
MALLLLLGINLFNYLDRYVLAGVLGGIQASFFPKVGDQTESPALQQLQAWCQDTLGFKPELALLGLLSMAFMVVYMVGAPIFGRLAERRSRWGLVGIGVMLWSLASGASGLASGFFALLLTRCFIGIGESAYGPVAPTLIADLFPVKQRGRALAWFYMAIPVGSALGYVLGGMVLDSGIGTFAARTLGIHAENWRWAFYLVLIPGLALGLLSLFMREPLRGQSDQPHGLMPAKVSAREYLILFRTPAYVLCTLGMTAMTFAMGGIAFWMPYYLQHQPGATGSVIVTFGSITCAAGLVATLFGGWVGDRLRARFSGSYFLVSGIAMFVGLPFMLLMLHSPFPLTWVWVFITCFCLFFNTGPTNTILANVVHPSIRAAGFALNIFIIHAFGDVLSPVVIGILSDRFDMTAAFSVVSLMFPIAGLLWLWGAHYLARDTERALTKSSAAKILTG